MHKVERKGKKKTGANRCKVNLSSLILHTRIHTERDLRMAIVVLI